MRDYYQVLGVSRCATSEELRAAYARLAKRHHPDLSGAAGTLPQRLYDVQQAYRCLSDTDRRMVHDQALDMHEKAHLASQNRVRRRLYRYDRRHPRRAPHPRRGVRWRPVVISIAIAVATAMIWLS